MKTACIVTLAALMAGAGWPAAAESAIFDRNGRMTSMFYSGEELGVRGRVQIPSRDWNRAAEPAAPRSLAGDVAAAEDQPGSDQRRSGIQRRDPDRMADQSPVGRRFERAVPGMELGDEDVRAHGFDGGKRGKPCQCKGVEDRADDSGARSARPRRRRRRGRRRWTASRAQRRLAECGDLDLD